MVKSASVIVDDGNSDDERFEARVDREVMKSSYMILETELSPAEVDGLRKVTRHAPAKSAISKKVRDRLVTLAIY